MEIVVFRQIFARLRHNGDFRQRVNSPDNDDERLIDEISLPPDATALGHVA
jgi:hypothetical protein